MDIVGGVIIAFSIAGGLLMTGSGFGRLKHGPSEVIPSILLIFGGVLVCIFGYVGGADLRQWALEQKVVERTDFLGYLTGIEDRGIRFRQPMPVIRVSKNKPWNSGIFPQEYYIFDPADFTPEAIPSLTPLIALPVKGSTGQ